MKTFVEVKCPNKAHGRCVLTKVFDPSNQLGREGQGRCLGVVGAFILSATEAGVDSKAAHVAMLPGFSRARRLLGRSALRDDGGLVGLFECERPRHTGEESEPEFVPH
eukprot:3648404-Pyramimonas_sp.AAC.1